VRPSRRGWGFLAAGAVAFIAAYSSGLPALLWVACLLLALPLFSLALISLRRPRLTARRVFAPRVVPAGSVTTVSVVVSNAASARSLPATWWDAVPWHPWVTPPGALPAMAPRGPRYARANARTVQYELTPPRRGIVPVGPLTVEVDDVFHLVSARAVVGAPESLIVTPEVVPLADSGLSVPAGDGASRLVQRRSSGDDDDAMTREYRHGDAMRRVHWKASARSGDLMVRQEEQRSFPEARILVDTMRGGYRDAEGRYGAAESDAFEWVVRMLASLAVHLRRVGFVVAISETGPEQLDRLGRSRRRTWGDEEFLTGLASLHLTESAAPMPVQRGVTGPVFALLANADPHTIDWMLAHRTPGELAVAFVVRAPTAIDHLERSFGVPPDVTTLDEYLANAGWLVVPVRADDDHAAAWEAVVAELGRSRGAG
jgi:uncharacterized protein (DUF58 family)